MNVLQQYMEDGDKDMLVKSFNDDMSPEERIEVMSIIEKMLLLGGPSKSMVSFVRLVLDNCEICTGMKCRIAEMVYEADDPEYVKHIRKWIAMDDMEIACRTQWIKQISSYPLYRDVDQVRDWVDHIFCHPTISQDDFYRFRLVMDAFQHYEGNSMTLFVSMMTEYKALFNDPVMYKVTLAQSLVQKDMDEHHKFKDNSPELLFLTSCLDELLSVLLTKDQPPETQADICDFFLNTEYDRFQGEYRTVAERTMTELFRENLVSEISIFSNRQNVHSETIEKSSQEIIQELHKKYGLMPITFQKVQGWHQEMQGWTLWEDMSENDQSKATLAVHRILFDKKLYGETGDTLMTIFGLVWRHVHHSTHKEELQKRLLEELVEASGQCSTGIAVRITNTLSGFDDFMIRISHREAILAKVMNHMNKTIMSMEDEDLQDQLLQEMTLPLDQYAERKNFLELFRKEVPTIKELLYEEFKDQVSDTDFDLYLRQALLVYEG